ncbi:MAG: hypothetical protein ACI4TM_06780 [Candidatus Cryptobacteroides sp.]
MKFNGDIHLPLILMLCLTSCTVSSGELRNVNYDVDTALAEYLYGQYVEPAFRSVELCDCFSRCWEDSLERDEALQVCISYFGTLFNPEDYYDYDLFCAGWGKVRPTRVQGQYLVEPYDTNFESFTVTSGGDGEWNVSGSISLRSGMVIDRTMTMTVSLSIQDDIVILKTLDAMMLESNGDKALLSLHSDSLQMALTSFGSYCEYPSEGVLHIDISGGYDKSFDMVFNQLNHSIMAHE